VRDAFFSELYTIFRHDRRIVFLTGDLGYKLFDQLKEHDPSRVINCGIREAGMIGYAAGLAKTGLLPFVYSITPFVTLRCLEQIKIDLCYNQANVVIVGVGGGFAYGPNGPTESPAYLRLGRNKEPHIFDSQKDSPDISQPAMVREGSDGVIITSGFILHEVLKAVDLLNQHNIHPAVVRITTLRPFPKEYISLMIANSKQIMTVEEHVATGGLGQETAKIVAETCTGTRFRMLAIPLEFPDACYDRESLLARSGLDADSIAAAYRTLANKGEAAFGGG